MMNPYTPMFGVTPPYLAGRDEQLAAFREALADGIGAPGRAMLITGERGIGKTALLNAFHEIAREAGWLVVSGTTFPGIADELATSRIAKLIHEYDPYAREFIPTRGGRGGLDVGTSMPGYYIDHVPQPRFDFRSGLEKLADVAFRESDGGVLVTIDALHAAATDDLRQICHAVQHCFRDGRDVAFVAAGLPHFVQGLLENDLTSFLRRTEHFALDRLTEADTRRAFAEPANEAWRPFEEDALDCAVAGARNYPFFVQVIGHYAWKASTSEEHLTRAAVEISVEKAISRSGRYIHGPMLDELSVDERRFVSAMAADEGPSAMADVATRLGDDPVYVNQQRERMIAVGLIVPTSPGHVDFAMPYLREYMRGTSLAPQ